MTVDLGLVELVSAILIVTPILVIGILVGAELYRRMVLPVMNSLLKIASKRKGADRNG